MTVVDAGVLVDAAGRRDRRGQRARRSLEGEAVVPDVAFIEALSVLRRQYLAGFLGRDRFDLAAFYLEAVPVRVHPSRPMLPRMTELAHSVSAYDAAYVALAEALEVPLVTTDERLAAAHGPRCEIRVLS